MKNSEKYLLHYLTANYSNTAKWGILCTTVGYQIVAPRCHYPLSIHPDNYNFKRYGRILHEYQFVYIVAGSGYFTSDSCATTKVSAGTIIMLFLLRVLYAICWEKCIIKVNAGLILLFWIK